MANNNESIVLKAKRSQIKAHLTREANYLNKLDMFNLNQETTSQLQLRLSKIEPLLDAFNNIQSEIETLNVVAAMSSGDDEYNENEIINQSDEIYRESFENAYFELVSKFKSVLNSVQNSTSNQSSASSCNSTRNIDIKLPTIKLPSFNGQYECWLEFRDAFTALIHNNESLSPVQKFYYLRSSLEREASNIIKSIEATDSNYLIAWQLLQERFENKGLIIHNHIKAILEHPIVTKESHYELRNLYDNITKNLRSLENIGEPVNNWDSLIIYIISSKLDSITRREWESHRIKFKNPKMSDMNIFLQNKCELLQKLKYNKISRPSGSNYNSNSYASSSKGKGSSQVYTVQVNKFVCYVCKNEHSIYNCEQFLGLSVQERYQQARILKLCFNCLRPNHSPQNCELAGCKKCRKRHNTLLHFDSNNVSSNRVVPSDNTNSTSINAVEVQAIDNSVTISNHSLTNSCQSQILLSTAIIEIQNSQGDFIKCRAFIDSGAQSNFMTNNLLNQLGLPKHRANCSISGVGQNFTDIDTEVRTTIRSCYNSYADEISFFVLNSITEKLPVSTFDKSILDIPHNMPLADPDFNVSAHVDVLLGIQVFSSILRNGQFELGKNKPILFKTRLGWIISGNLINVVGRNRSINCSSIVTNKVLEDSITKFWSIEEYRDHNKLPKIFADYCETHFVKNHTRTPEGRFIVKIPFKENKYSIGSTKDLAIKRFQTLEQRLSKNVKLKQDYVKFMRDYIELGHMSEANDDDNFSCYLPHHAVFKHSSLTTKTRVVFDGSMKSSNGISLNDIQYVGPTIQNDLLSILLRFRIHKFVMTADIAKMYRQVLVANEDRVMQKIFWRESPQEKLIPYTLNTVSYGTASASFLAIRCLHELANEYQNQFPQASSIIKRDFYVDDVLTGANSVEELFRIKNDISNVLCKGGFELRKWLTNTPEVTLNFQSHLDSDNTVTTIGSSEDSRILGILWNSLRDCLQYDILNINESINTKRGILATICKIFDPLGLLSPTIIRAKIIIQCLWQAKIGWDDEIPADIQKMWLEFSSDLKYLNSLSIPRYVLEVAYISIQIHGFCDASTKAYGASIYMRCEINKNKTITKLMCAKTRVAPIKPTTLPRLELSSAVLLANLCKKVLESINLLNLNVYYWSDSTITLAWLKRDPAKWKTFVANRVGEIQELTNINNWGHVRSQENPADLLTRGISPRSLLDNILWWCGPSWLSQIETEWPRNYEISEDEIPEQRQIANIVISIDSHFLFNKFSSLTKLQRVFAYVLRFINNTKNKRDNRKTGCLETYELQNSLTYLTALSQKCSFHKEFQQLAKNQQLSNSSRILSLSPFLDVSRIIRVGGRLKYSNYNFSKKHPILICHKHPLTYLILQNEHARLKHCGPQQLLASVRETFWPTSGRSICRKVVRNCITCFKCNPKPDYNLMGDLPSVRTNQCSPFSNTGLDYAGPYLLRDRTLRNYKLVKSYVCIFICMVTRAVHLELVHDLTSEAFLSAIRRFIARRGMPINLYSDNATTFVGANSKLSEFYTFLNRENGHIQNTLATIDKVQWHFIPPRAPNFGGLWEAAVKSFKRHLIRVIGSSNLTFEGFYTVLTQIEAIMNSRPISPLSSDPNDLQPLTPGHFLIGRSLTTLPETPLLDVQENRLSIYNKIQQLIQHFWKRWHQEYVCELQRRTKWKQQVNSITPGSMVLIKDECAPPLQWKLGRVIEIHPGKDHIVRVVSVKTNSGIVKRSISKVCVLPTPTDDQ